MLERAKRKENRDGEKPPAGDGAGLFYLNDLLEELEESME